MFKYILQKIATAVLLLFAVATFLFLLIEIAPGDPVQALIGGFPVPDEYRAEMEEKFGLGVPLYQRYFEYIASMMQGDLGYSFANRQPVLDVIHSRVGNTLILSLAAAVLSTVVGILLGIIAARRKGKFGDSAFSVFALAGYSFPIFFLAQVLVLIFAVNLHWFPVQGMESIVGNRQGFDRVMNIAWHLVLPAVVLATREIGINIRMSRATVLDAMSSEYITTARAKGLSESQAVRRHAFPNALLPIVTVVGYNLGHVLAGSVLVETVFSWPGIGRLIYESISSRDTPVIVGVFLVITLSIIIVNTITDLLYKKLDPRVNVGRKSA